MSAASDPPPPYNTLFGSSVDLSTPKAISSTDTVELLNTSFEDKNARITFIKSVLNIIMLQYLAVTHVLVIAVILVNEYSDVNEFTYRYNTILIVVSTLLFLTIAALLVYCDEARWRAPYKYLFLVVFPLVFSAFITAVTIPHFVDVILITFVFFCVNVVILKLCSNLAADITVDKFVRYGMYIIVVLLIVMFGCTVTIFKYSVLYVIYATLAAFLLSAYVLLDLRAMMANDYRFSIGPEDFAKGALILHIDYLYIVTKIYTPKRST